MSAVLTRIAAQIDGSTEMSMCCRGKASSHVIAQITNDPFWKEWIGEMVYESAGCTPFTFEVSVVRRNELADRYVMICAEMMQAKNEELFPSWR